ncbi:7TM chemoreceptor [Ostertagia ostertagi]
MIECDDFNPSMNFYLIFMHCLSVIDLYLNMLAIYCILYKSTKQMGAYKWYLLAYQVVSTSFDFIYTAVTLPVIFFPVPMGYPAGVFSQWLSISTHACTIIVVITCSWLIATILSLFNYRRHLVTPAYPFFNFTDRGHFYTSVAIFTIYFVPCIIGCTSIFFLTKWMQEDGLKSCGKSAVFLPHIQIFTPWKVKRIAITALALAGVAFLITAGCILVSFYFLSRNKRLSPKTRQMQRRFLIYLCVQVAIPAITMFVPIIA